MDAMSNRRFLIAGLRAVPSFAWHLARVENRYDGDFQLDGTLLPHPPDGN
jgi:hypothetical protein